MNGTVRDGTRVLFLVVNFSSKHHDEYERNLVRGFAIGGYAVTRKRAIMPEGDEPPFDVRTLGYLRPGFEGVRWCRGWKGKAARALLAQVALENSR